MNRDALTWFEKREFIKFAQDYIWSNDTVDIKKEIDHFAQEIEQHARATNDLSEKVLDYFALGDYFQYYKDRDESRGLWVPYYEKVIRLAGNDPRFISKVAYAKRGVAIYRVQQSKYEEASQLLNSALGLFKQTNDTVGISSLHAFYSSLYSSLLLYEKAIKEHYLTVNYFTGQERRNGLAAFYLHENFLERALTYLAWYERDRRADLLDSANFYIQRTAHFEGRRQEQGIGTHYYLRGYRAFLLNDYQSAVNFIDSSLAVEEYYAELNPAKMVYKGLSLLKLGRKKEARQILENLELGYIEHSMIEMAYRALYEDARAEQKFEKALNYQEIANSHRDSAAILAQRGKVFEVMQKYAMVEKDMEIQNLAFANIAKEHQRNNILWIFAFTTVVLLMIIISLYNIGRARKLRALKTELQLHREKKNREEIVRLQERDLQRARNKVVFNLRKRISRDLHDEISSSLAGLRYYVNDLRLRVQNEQIQEVLKEVEQEVESVYVQARNYMHNLNSGINDAVGKLSPFLQSISSHFGKKFGVDLRLKYDSDEIEARLSALQQNQLTLILKEATTNILKHSGASVIEVAIYFEQENCHFSISDNGCGFEQKNIPRGLGLESMKVRMQRMNGKLLMSSSVSGTRITGWFPIR